MGRMERRAPAVVQVYHGTHVILFHCIYNTVYILPRCSERFFDQHILFMFGRRLCDVRMCEIRCYDCNSVAVCLFKHLVVIIIHFFDPKLCRQRFRFAAVHIADGVYLRKRMFLIDPGMVFTPDPGAYNCHFNS